VQLLLLLVLVALFLWTAGKSVAAHGWTATNLGTVAAAGVVSYSALLQIARRRSIPSWARWGGFALVLGAMFIALVARAQATYWPEAGTASGADDAVFLIFWALFIPFFVWMVVWRATHDRSRRVQEP
jgi:hypothetical protein